MALFPGTRLRGGVINRGLGTQYQRIHFGLLVSGGGAVPVSSVMLGVSSQSRLCQTYARLSRDTGSVRRPSRYLVPGDYVHRDGGG